MKALYPQISLLKLKMWLVAVGTMQKTQQVHVVAWRNSESNESLLIHAKFVGFQKENSHSCVWIKKRLGYIAFRRQRSLSIKECWLRLGWQSSFMACIFEHLNKRTSTTKKQGCIWNHRQRQRLKNEISLFEEKVRIEKF